MHTVYWLTSIPLANLVVQLARFFIIYIAVCPTRINCSTLYATPVGPREIPERLRRKLYVYFQNTTSIFRICGICRYTVVGATAKSGSLVGRKRSACFAAKSTRIGHRSMLLSRPETTVVINQVHVTYKPSLVISSASYFCVLNTRSKHTPVQKLMTKTLQIGIHNPMPPRQ